jgi:hypothetical protein
MNTIIHLVAVVVVVAIPLLRRLARATMAGTAISSAKFFWKTSK